MNIANLKVGDKVGVARPGNWGIRSEGIYAVTKIDKVKVVVRRESDGYERYFSAKSGSEKGGSGYYTPCLESTEDQQQREAARAARQNLECAWSELERAAQSKNLEAARAALAAVAQAITA